MEYVESSKHFSKKELMCKCGCGVAKMKKSFMDIVEKIREEYGKPIILSSAYRCPEYNNKISSTGFDGPHTTGEAIDIKIFGDKAVKLIKLGLKYDMRRFGVNQKGNINLRFIHMDKVADKIEWIWSY